MDFNLNEPVNDLSWSDLNEGVQQLGEVVTDFTETKVKNAATTQAYNAAIVAQMNQDTENKRVLMDYAGKAVLVLVLGVVGYLLIKTFRKN